MPEGPALHHAISYLFLALEQASSPSGLAEALANADDSVSLYRELSMGDSRCMRTTLGSSYQSSQTTKSQGAIARSSQLDRPPRRRTDLRLQDGQERVSRATGSALQFDVAALQCDHYGVGAIIRGQFGEDTFQMVLDRVL